MRRYYIDGFLDALELVQREVRDCKDVEEVMEILERLIILAKERRLDEIRRELGYFRTKINTR